MKISLKIIIAAFAIIPLLTAASFIYVMVNTEVEPAELVDRSLSLIDNPGEFNSIEARRGEWDVRIVQSDSFYVTCQGGDNLLFNLLKTDIVDSVFVIDLDSAVISENVGADITVAMPVVQSLKVNNSSYFHLNHFNQSEMRIDISNGGISIKNCRIENLTVHASGNGYVGISESEIGTFDYNIQDSAYMFVKGDMNSGSARIDDMGHLVNITDDKNFAVKISGQRKIISEQMNSYFGGLKWYMPIDTVMEIMEKDSMNFRLRDDDLKYLPRYFSTREILMYYNISDDNPEFNNVQLSFYRGLLTDILISYKSFTDLEKIYNNYYSLFTEKFGEQHEQVIPTIIEADWNEEFENYWIATEGNPENQYTIIRLIMYDINWLSVYYSSSRKSLFTDRIERVNRWNTRNLNSFPNLVEYLMSMFRVPGS